MIKLQEHGYQHNAKRLRRLPTRPQNPRYEDNNLVLEIQTPKEKLCCPVCGSHNINRNGSNIRRFVSVQDISWLLQVSWNVVRNIQMEFLQSNYSNSDLSMVRRISIGEFALIKGMYTRPLL